MDYLRVGIIVRPHGVRGAVKVEPLSDDSGRFNALSEAYIENDGYYLPVKVTGVSVQPDAVQLKLSCSNSRDDAEMLRNRYICVDRAHAIKLPEDSWFITDLIGCSVSANDGRQLGTLRDVLQTGAADVYVIEGESARLLVPALKRLIASVDTANKRIVLDAGVLSEVGLFED